MLAEDVGKWAEGGAKVARKMLVNGSINAVVTAKERRSVAQTFKSGGFGILQGAVSAGYDTLKILAGTSGFQVGSVMIGYMDYLDDFALGLLDAGTMW